MFMFYTICALDELACKDDLTGDRSKHINYYWLVMQPSEAVVWVTGTLLLIPSWGKEMDAAISLFRGTWKSIRSDSGARSCMNMRALNAFTEQVIRQTRK